jgi:hypothetical protein
MGEGGSSTGTGASGSGVSGGGGAGGVGGSDVLQRHTSGIVSVRSRAAPAAEIISLFMHIGMRAAAQGCAMMAKRHGKLLWPN